jgi:eukaryotic translation initiation factor 2C
MKTPTIIIGADVTHPAPADRMLSSVAACIGSYDKDFSHYCASITVQKRSREEIITRFDFMIEELLIQFQKCNQILPKNIVVFRDGVSEGQFDQVLDHEYKLLVETCHKLEPKYNPLVTFIIVQKRHHTRFLPLNEADAIGRAGNVPPGTVVDTTVTHPSLQEYFLNSHNGMIVSLIKFIKFVVIFKHFLITKSLF